MVSCSCRALTTHAASLLLQHHHEPRLLLRWHAAAILGRPRRLPKPLLNVRFWAVPACYACQCLGQRGMPTCPSFVPLATQPLLSPVAPCAAPCSTLTCRDLSGNYIEGSIPDSWRGLTGGFQQMSNMDLGQTRLRSTLPVEWDLPNLYLL